MKINKKARTFMPFEGGLSPVTDKSTVPFNNVHTVQDVLDGKTYKMPGAGGDWGTDWGKDGEKSYKPDGDQYKFLEEYEARQNYIMDKMLNGLPSQVQEVWTVKTKGGKKECDSYEEALRYVNKLKAKGVPVKWMSKIKEAQVSRPNVIEDSLSKTFMIESIDTMGGTKEAGAAFAISQNKVLTCAHVIKRYNKNNYSPISTQVLNQQLRIQLYFGGKIHEGIVEKIDWAKDLALVKFNLNFDFFEIDPIINVGDNVVAIGSPHGFENNSSFGRVGSKDRKIYNHAGAPYYFTIDAPIFSGNSGGPVVNEDNGKVIGMVTAVVSMTGDYGLNMSLPSQYIVEFLKG